MFPDHYHYVFICIVFYFMLCNAKCRNKALFSSNIANSLIVEVYYLLKKHTIIHHLYFNPYKPSVLFVGHMQTLQTQISRHKRGV